MSKDWHKGTKSTLLMSASKLLSDRIVTPRVGNLNNLLMSVPRVPCISREKPHIVRLNLV